MKKTKTILKIIKHSYLYLYMFSKVREHMLIFSYSYGMAIFTYNPRMYRVILWAVAYRNKKEPVEMALHKVGIA